MSPRYSIRLGSPDDLATVIEHRGAIFRDMGHAEPAWLDAMSSAATPWFKEKMRSGQYLAWFMMTADGAIAAGAGLLLTEWPPGITDLNTKRAVIFNVYTVPAHHKQGLARQLVQDMLEWCRENQITTVTLHASNDGRPLYTALGFQPTNEMRLHMKLSV
jgi:GNAT superfamily N-acetyltransferase